MALKAAIFDIGGVLTVSPVDRITSYSAEHGISDSARMAIFAHGESIWSRFERSELTRDQFAAEFDTVISADGGTVTGAAFMEWFFQGFEPRPEVIAVVEYLRGRVKLGAITNNVARDEPAERRTAGLDIQRLFDVVVESAVVGLRKPDPRIYTMTCDLLGVHPADAVFLDDIGQNLKAARALGMTTIRVDASLGAIDELEAALGFALPRLASPA